MLAMHLVHLLCLRVVGLYVFVTDRPCRRDAD
jgi:hypothetical protein